MFEARSVADKGDELGSAHSSPPLLDRLDEFEDYGQGSAAGAGAASLSLAKPLMVSETLGPLPLVVLGRFASPRSARLQVVP